MNLPRNLLYSKTHEWIETIGTDTLRIGLTDYAQSKLGDIVFITLPEVGDELEAGGSFAEVESVKAVSEAFSPVSGTVSAINEALVDDPARVNANCYGAWLVEVKDVGGLEELLSADEYSAFVAREG